MYTAKYRFKATKNNLKKAYPNFSMSPFPTTIRIGTVCIGTTAKPKQAKMYRFQYEILEL